MDPHAEDVLVTGDPSELTRPEADRLRRCEQQIERAEAAQLRAGLALRDVRDGRLFRASHGTFAAYVADRWDRTPQWANGLIRFADLVERVGNLGFPVPVTERQARHLTRLNEPQLRDVVSCIEVAGGFPRMAASRVAEIVNETVGTEAGRIVLVSTSDGTGPMLVGDTGILKMLRAMSKLARRIGKLGPHALPTFVETLTPDEADEIRRLIANIVHLLGYLSDRLADRFGRAPSTGVQALFLGNGAHTNGREVVSNGSAADEIERRLREGDPPGGEPC